MKTLVSMCVATMMLGTAYASEGWVRDFEKAKKTAAEKNLPILVDFSGSDWCGWCIKLDKEVFSKEEFKTFAAQNLVLFLADFPRKTQLPDAERKQNEALAEKYKVEGFPAVLILDKDGNVLAQTGYKPGGAEAYVNHLKGLLPKPPASAGAGVKPVDAKPAAVAK